jgi:hypothetical protein
VRHGAIIAVAVLVINLAMPPQPALAASGWYPTSDYCGWVWRDGSSQSHNGWDIWTKSDGTGLAGSKGFPIQLSADGILREKYIFPGTSTAYGLRFWHPASGKSTHYWHMADTASLASYVESWLVVGTSYPAGTFLGYQGDLTTVNSTLTHLHLTVWNQDAADNGSLSTSVNPGNAGLNPSNFFDRNLDAQSGGVCYTGAWPTDNSIHYLGPLPQSEHPYPNNFARWYVVVNHLVSASWTRVEFCDLLTEANFDFVRTYGFSAEIPSDTFSGRLTPPSVFSSQIGGRVVRIHFTSDGSITDYGFRVCGYL